MASRTLGVLLFVQMAVAPVVNFALLGPAMAPPGFLANAAANPARVTAAVLLMLVAGAIPVGIAITALPVLRRHSPAMALWLLALGVAGLAGVLVEGMALRSMLALSQEYAKAGAADAGLFPALGAWAGSVRNSAHFTNFLLAGAWNLVLYGVLFRFALVPRALSAFGLATSALMMGGALIPLFGHQTVMLMFMPIGLSHLALVLWLVTKGFDERHHPVDATRPAPAR